MGHHSLRRDEPFWGESTKGHFPWWRPPFLEEVEREKRIENRRRARGKIDRKEKKIEKEEIGE